MLDLGSCILHLDDVLCCVVRAGWGCEGVSWVGWVWWEWRGEYKGEGEEGGGWGSYVPWSEGERVWRRIGGEEGRLLLGGKRRGEGRKMNLKS